MTFYPVTAVILVSMKVTEYNIPIISPIYQTLILSKILVEATPAGHPYIVDCVLFAHVSFW